MKKISKNASKATGTTRSCFVINSIIGQGRTMYARPLKTEEHPNPQTMKIARVRINSNTGKKEAFFPQINNWAEILEAFEVT